LRDVAEDFSIGNQIFVDVLAMVGDPSMVRFKEAGQHFDRGAFSRPVRPQIAEDLSGLERQGLILNGRDGAIEFREVFCLEHRNLPLTSKPRASCRAVIRRRRPKISGPAIRPTRSTIAAPLPSCSSVQDFPPAETPGRASPGALDRAGPPPLRKG